VIKIDTGHEGRITNFMIEKLRRYMFLTYENGDVCVYELFEAGKEKKMRHITTYEAKDELTAVALIPKKNYLVIGNESGLVYFIDVMTSKIIEVLPAHDERINTVEVIEEGKFLLTSSDSKDIKIWQI
jgi:hypothetical protein